MRNGEPIEDATNETYTLTDADIGRRISVKVSYGEEIQTSLGTEMVTKGDGTPTNPYAVATAEQLDIYVRANPAQHYEQTEDIDLSAYGNWQPLPEFSGVFDGKDHTISNLTINRMGDFRVGLFSRVSNGGY